MLSSIPESDHSSARHQFHDRLQALAADYERLVTENSQLRATLLQQAAPRPGTANISDYHGPVLDEKEDKQLVQKQLNHPAFMDDSAVGDKSAAVGSADHEPKAHKQSVVFNAGEASDGESDSDLETEKQPPLLAEQLAMKKIVKEVMREEKEAYDVRTKYKDSGVCQAIAKSSTFEHMTLVMIASYAVWMAVEADHNHADVVTEAETAFVIADQGFCAFFFIEILIRFLAFKRKINCLKDFWFVFDCVLVMAMVLEVWVMTVFILATSSSESPTSALGTAAILRVARLIRLSRMFRMVRLVRVVPELLIMVKAIVAATRAVFLTLVLLLVVLYVFGIAMVQTTRDTSIGEEKFNTVLQAMHSLVLHGTLLDDVSGIFQAMQDEDQVSSLILMYVFIILAAITIMNMLIGLLCEVITNVAATEKESLRVSWVRLILQRELKEAGIELASHGKLLKKDFYDLLSHPPAIQALRELDVDVPALADLAGPIFEDRTGHDEEDDPFRPLKRVHADLYDSDISRRSHHSASGEVRISFDDLMQAVMQLRTTNLATVKDIVDLRFYISLRVKALEDVVQHALHRSGRRSSTSQVSVSSMDALQVPPDHKATLQLAREPKGAFDVDDSSATEVALSDEPRHGSSKQKNGPRLVDQGLVDPATLSDTEAPSPRGSQIVLV